PDARLATGGQPHGAVRACLRPRQRTRFQCDRCAGQPPAPQTRRRAHRNGAGAGLPAGGAGMIRRPLSVGLRLWIAALALVLVILPLAGLSLVYNFRQAVTHSFDERLASLLKVVLAGVRYDPVSEQLVVTRALGDARFDRVFSGWYWQASDGYGLTVTSRSLWDQRLPVVPGGSG